MDDNFKRDLQGSLADAVGFVLGALAGWRIGQWLGFDFIATQQWDGPGLIGLVLIVAGCGAGRWLSHRVLALLTDK